MESVADESYDNPPPLVGDEASFSYRLENQVLHLIPKDHFARSDDAKKIVEPFLRTWELGPALADGKMRFWFVFDRAEVVDRQPRQPGEPQVISVETAHLVLTGHEVTCRIGRRKYLEPPTGITASPDVLTMWFRYEMFKGGKEPLTSMAYFCLTVLEGSTGKKEGARKAVCSMYKIDQKVRDTFGDLVSERGNGFQARKFDARATRDGFRGNEEKWIEQVVIALIRRKAEYDFDPNGSYPQIAMTDFVRLISI